MRQAGVVHVEPAAGVPAGDLAAGGEREVVPVGGSVAGHLRGRAVLELVAGHQVGLAAERHAQVGRLRQIRGPRQVRRGSREVGRGSREVGRGDREIGRCAVEAGVEAGDVEAAAARDQDDGEPA